MRRNIPMRPIIGEEELVVAWLAENGILPAKSEWGRYTLRPVEGGRSVGVAVQFLVIDNLGIESDEDLAEIRRKVRDHPRWDGPTR